MTYFFIHNLFLVRNDAKNECFYFVEKYIGFCHAKIFEILIQIQHFFQNRICHCRFGQVDLVKWINF